MSRRGFTLIELMVAIVLAGVVALLVYGTAATALGVQERVRTRRETLRATNGMRALIRDALRSARPGIAGAEASFRLEPGSNSSGRPLDRLVFVSVGGTPPLTDDTDWIVSLGAGPEGLVLTASPVGIGAPAPVVARQRNIRGLSIRVPGLGGDWTDEWDGLTPLPPVVRLVFWTDGGPEPPMLVVIPRGGVL